jgi:hypothetical protein
MRLSRNPTADIQQPPGRTARHYRFNTGPATGFATNEQFARNRIAVGDQAFLTGWFSGYYGAAQNHPIARFGP